VTLEAASEARRVTRKSWDIRSVEIAAGARATARIRLANPGLQLKEMILSNPPRIVLDVLREKPAVATASATAGRCDIEADRLDLEACTARSRGREACAAEAEEERSQCRAECVEAGGRVEARCGDEARREVGAQACAAAEAGREDRPKPALAIDPIAKAEPLRHRSRSPKRSRLRKRSPRRSLLPMRSPRPTRSRLRRRLRRSRHRRPLRSPDAKPAAKPAEAKPSADAKPEAPKPTAPSPTQRPSRSRLRRSPRRRSLQRPRARRRPRRPPRSR